MINGKLIHLNENNILPKNLDQSKQNKGKLNRFKRSCLKEKSTIYQDSILRIGVKTGNFIDNRTDDAYLRIEVFYKNVSQNMIRNLKVNIANTSRSNFLSRRFNCY